MCGFLTASNTNLKFRAWQKPNSQFCIWGEYLNQSLRLWSPFIIKLLWVFNGKFRIWSISLWRGRCNLQQKACTYFESYTLLYTTQGALEEGAIENGEGVEELFVSCRSVLSAFGLGMASLRGLLCECPICSELKCCNYVRLSHVVTPHKPLIKENSTYPVRNPSCCCGQRLRQLLCVLPCTVKLHVSWMRGYFVQARVAFNTQRTLNFSRGPARVNSDKRHGPKSSDSAQMK